ncbi:MAG: hypothetical protein JW947_05725 [Sedimentisphaerales bacterium]|nr:hypothetical protein [Sedimentisphaerales bacterium]
MFRIKYKQGDAKKRITVALVLVCLMVYTADVQLYIEQRILDNAATCTDKLGRFNKDLDYFNMSLPELMEVVVVSSPEERPSSYLLDFHSYRSDLVPKPI